MPNGVPGSVIDALAMAPAVLTKAPVALTRGPVSAESTEVSALVGPAPPSEGAELAGPFGFAYACRECDVYGYAGPGDVVVCWSCESAKGLHQR